MVANVCEVKWIVKKELLGGTKKLKEAIHSKETAFRALLTNKSYEQL